MSIKSLFFCVTMIGCVGHIATSDAEAQKAPKPDRKILYKETKQAQLELHLFQPKAWKASDRRSVVVFFFGGGWVGGTPSQFYWHARELANQGMVAACAEYRVNRQHKTSPFDAVDDANSAIRFVREHAGELGIDPSRVVSSGGSAGGHLAVCTAVLEKVDIDSVKKRASSVPNVVIAFNPVLDTGPKGYGYSRLKERYREISPVDHIRKKLPPMLIFHGTADTTVPFENATRFTELMTKADNECQLVSFKGMKHGFFNHGRNENRSYVQTMKHTTEFLGKHGMLELTQKN